MGGELYGPPMEFWLNLSQPQKVIGQVIIIYNIKSIRKANKMEIVNNHVYFAGRNFAATQTRSVREEAIFLRTHFSLEPPVYRTES